MMSTVKTDAITAVSTNGDLSLDGIGTGGVSIASTLKMTKGGDISSASPLVIDTDGNYFDVTGTTNFAAMTVEEGNFFMLQFDGALTITHGSGIELPGAANLTTAAGDRLICYATAANTVEVMSVETEAAASAGGFTLGTEQATTSGSSVTFTGIPSGTTQINLMLNHVSGNGTGTYTVTIGDSGGLETSGYEGGATTVDAGHMVGANGAAFIVLKTSSAAQFFNGVVSFYLEDSSANTWSIYGIIGDEPGGNDVCSGSKSLSGELTQLSFIMADTMDAGAVNISYQ